VKARLIIILIAGCAVQAACGRGDPGPEVLGTLERDRLELTAEAREPIVEIMVREGETVATGQPLLRQAEGEMAARLAGGQATLAQAEHRFAELTHGPRPDEIADARAQLAAAASSLATTRREYERVDSLVEKQLLSRSELDRAQASLDEASARQKQARARLDLLIEGTRIEELDQARAAVDRARADLAEVETSAQRYTLAAPRNGIVEALPYRRGERPPAGATLVVMLADSTPFARVHVPEPLRQSFSPGVEVDVRVDGIDTVFRGRVRFVATQASFTPYYSLTQRDRSRLAFLAEIDLPEDTARALPSGIPVQVRLRDET
jgi:HlyD family secretion protein